MYQKRDGKKKLQINTNWQYVMNCNRTEGGLDHHQLPITNHHQLPANAKA